MRNPHKTQDIDDIVERKIRDLGVDEAAQRDRLLRELDAISANVESGRTAVEAPKPARRVSSVNFQSPDFDEPDIIKEPIRLKRYDKARAKLREAEARLRDAQAKRDAISALAAPTDHDRSRLAVHEHRIADALAAVQKAKDAVRKAQTDHQQRLDEIDRYRAEEGRETYNAKRRKVRLHGNADLSGMTPEERKQHAKDRRSDANWFARQRQSGMTEAFITSAYAKRVQRREAKRAGSDTE